MKLKQAIDTSNPDSVFDINFSDLYDLGEIQTLQDLFSDATGVASIITHPDGTPITNPSNFCRLCKDIIRKTEKGLLNCYHSDAVLGKYNPSGPVVRPCLSGALWDAGASITVGGRHIANWLIGQVRNEDSDEQRIMNYAEEIGANREEFIAAYQEVPVMSVQQFNKVSKMLFAYANELSEKAYKNLQLKMQIAEQEKARALLRESEERFQLLFTKAPLGYQSLDAEGKFIEVNQAWLDTLGYRREEVIGKWFGDFLSPEYTDAFRERFPMFKEAGKIHSEFKMVHKSGDFRFIAFEGRIAYNPDGNFKQTHCILVDITERKQFEEALRESEEQYRTIVDTAHDIIWMVDTSGNFTFINKRAEEITGHRSSDWIGKSFVPLVFPEDLPKVQEVFMKVLQGEQQSYDVRIFGSKREIFILSVSSVPIYHDNILSSSVSFGRDITEHKETEELLVKLKKAVGTSGEAIFITDQAGVLRYINPAFTFLYGYTSEEVVGKVTPRILKSPCMKPEDYEIFWKTILNKQEVRGEIINKTKDGKVINIESSASPILDDLNNIIGFLGIQRDITGRKLAEKEILLLNEELDLRVKQRTAELEAANRELETFSYSVSHDLKAPLRHINGFIGLFLENKSTELTVEEHGYLKKITDSANEMGQLIEALLSFSRLNMAELRKSTIHSSVMVQQVIKFFEPEIKDRNIAINIAPLTDVQGDADLIQQVWTNLISNAIKYTGKKSESVIEIGCRTAVNAITFFVKDNGAGFEMKYADKLFGVFQRLHKARDFEGVGIGLANVKRIVTRHGGYCHAEGEPEKGATFYFTLPG